LEFNYFYKFREAKAGTLDFGRITGWISLFYEGFQLSSFSFMENFEFTKNESSPMKFEFLEKILSIVNIVSLKFSGFIPLLMFIFFWVVTISQFLWTIILDKKAKNFINVLVLDMMYIPAMSSFVETFVCTFKCKYFGDITNVQLSPRMDMYHNISCNSVGYYIWFAAAILGILVMHPMSLDFVQNKKNDDDPAMRMVPSFNICFYVFKVLPIIFLNFF